MSVSQASCSPADPPARGTEKRRVVLLSRVGPGAYCICINLSLVHYSFISKSCECAVRAWQPAILASSSMRLLGSGRERRGGAPLSLLAPPQGKGGSDDARGEPLHRWGHRNSIAISSWHPRLKTCVNVKLFASTQIDPCLDRIVQQLH